MFLCANDMTKVAAEGGQSLLGTPVAEGGECMAVRRAISLNFDKKMYQSHRNGRDFENYLAARTTIISYRPMVNDFEFIQLFGGIRVPIDEGRKSQKEIRVILIHYVIWPPYCDHKDLQY
jgi:hypothetical protein